MNVLTIAYYTAIKYMRNVFTLLAFIIIPILMVLILTGSTEMKYANSSNLSINSNYNKELKIVTGVKNVSNLKVIVEKPKAGELNKNDKISIAVIFIFIFYGSLLTSYSIINDFKNNTYLRLKTSPIKNFENLLGKSLGNFSILAISTIVLVIITKFMFKVSWGEDPYITAAAIIMFLLIINSLGIILTVFSKNIFICALICFSFNFTMVLPVMTEAYSPTKSQIMQTVSKFSFHSYVMKAIISGGSREMLNNSIVILGLITIIMIVLSLAAGRRILR